MSSLTGNIRYRFGFFGKIILQVEELVPMRYAGPPRPSAEQKYTVHWRDATKNDMTVQLTGVRYETGT